MHFRLVSESNRELVAASVVEHVARGVFASDVGLGLRGFVLVRNGVVLGEVVELGHLEDVRLVELVPVGLLDRGGGLGGVVELDKGESLRDAVGALGHVETVLADDADLTVDLSDDGAELLELGVRHLREVVDDDHGAEARLGLDFLDVDALVVADDAHVVARGHLQVLDVNLGPVDVAILRRVGKRAANVSADGGNEGGKAQGLRRDGAEIAVFSPSGFFRGPRRVG